MSTCPAATGGDDAGDGLAFELAASLDILLTDD
jgi:hypothetical protein